MRTFIKTDQRHTVNPTATNSTAFARETTPIQLTKAHSCHWSAFCFTTRTDLQSAHQQHTKNCYSASK